MSIIWRPKAPEQLTTYPKVEFLASAYTNVLV